MLFWQFSAVVVVVVVVVVAFWSLKFEGYRHKSFLGFFSSIGEGSIIKKCILI